MMEKVVRESISMANEEFSNRDKKTKFHDICPLQEGRGKVLYENSKIREGPVTIPDGVKIMVLKVPESENRSKPIAKLVYVTQDV